MFEQLLPLTTTKNQQKIVEKFIEKGFKLTRQNDVEKMVALVYDFYISDNHQAVNLCLDYVMSFGIRTYETRKQFLNWVYIEPMYHLKHFISDEATKKALYQKLIDANKHESIQHLLVQDAGKHDMQYIEEWQQANHKKRLNNIYAPDFMKKSIHEFTTEKKPKDRYEMGQYLITEYLMLLFHLPEVDVDGQKILDEFQNHIAEMKKLYAVING